MNSKITCHKLSFRKTETTSDPAKSSVPYYIQLKRYAKKRPALTSI